MLAVAFVGFLTLFGCSQASLVNGKSTATFRGVKIFSPTVLSLSDGQCQVPSVDASGLVQQPTSTAPPGDSKCSTAVMTVNGVDVKSLVNVLETAVLSFLAAG
jgi:hypothetical protein